MGAALGWGALAASSLVIGVGLAFVRNWSPLLIGLILAFGAGALISAVSLELAQEGLRLGSGAAVGAGLALGALTYYTADGVLARRDKTAPGKGGGGSGTSLALGSFLDGVPEQAVLGIGLAGGEPVSVALLVAIFVSNLPEGIGAGVDMQAAGMARARSSGCFSWSQSSAPCPVVSGMRSPTRFPEISTPASTASPPGVAGDADRLDDP